MLVDDQHIISILGPLLFLLYVNCLPDVVRSIQIVAFADDTKVFEEITSTRDAEQLQEDLSDLITWSVSASLNFNYNKCKAASRGNLNPSSLSIIWPALNLKLSLPRRILVFTSRITSRGISKSMCQCAKANRLLPICTEKHQTHLKHYGQMPGIPYLCKIPLGYAAQVWTPQSIDLIRKLERVQRRARGFICDQT